VPPTCIRPSGRRSTSSSWKAHRWSSLRSPSSIRSPGGLFGTVTEEDLGRDGTSSSRNAHLARLLQDVTLPGTDQVVCENRGTGVPAMIQALRRAGMTPPRFDSRLSRFQVTFPKHALLDARTLGWIAGLGQQGLSDTQAMALALMRESGSVNNGKLRQLGVERQDATAALTDLVDRRLAVRFGGRRYAEYLLVDDALERFPVLDLALDPAPGAAPRPHDRMDEVAALFDGGEILRAADVAARTGLQLAMVRRYLNRLVTDGRVEPTAPPQSRRRAYRRPT
jgi:ATP-dependent DNA helicase RecG